MVEIPHKLKQHSLERNQLGTGVFHAFYADVSIVDAHGAACINDQMYAKIVLEQIETSLSHAHMCLNSVQNDLVSVQGFHIVEDWRLYHRKLTFVKNDSSWMLRNNIVNFLKILFHMSGSYSWNLKEAADFRKSFSIMSHLGIFENMLSKNFLDITFQKYRIFQSKSL